MKLSEKFLWLSDMWQLVSVVVKRKTMQYPELRERAHELLQVQGTSAFYECSTIGDF